MEAQRLTHECFVTDNTIVQYVQIKIPNDQIISFVTFNEQPDNEHGEEDNRFFAYVSMKPILLFVSEHLEIDVTRLKKLQNQFFKRNNNLTLYKSLIESRGLNILENAPDLPPNMLFANLISVHIFLMDAIDMFNSKKLSDLFDLLLKYYMSLTPTKHNLLEQARHEDDNEDECASNVTTISDHHVEEEREKIIAYDDDEEEEDDETNKQLEDQPTQPYKLKYLTETYYRLIDMYPEVPLERKKNFIELGTSINQLKQLKYVECKKKYNLFVHTHLLRLKILSCTFDLKRYKNNPLKVKVLRTALRYMKAELIEVYKYLEKELA